MEVRIGYFAEFDDRNTILLDGDRDGLLSLAKNLRSLEESGADPLELHELPFVKPYGSIRLTAYPISRELGLRKVQTSKAEFEWHHSEEGWLEAAEKIEAVATGHKGHNWLDSLVVDDAAVLVSLGEYGETWWGWNTA